MIFCQIGGGHNKQVIPDPIQTSGEIFWAIVLQPLQPTPPTHYNLQTKVPTICRCLLSHKQGGSDKR